MDDPALEPVTQDQLARLYVLVLSIAKAMVRKSDLLGSTIIEELNNFRKAGSTLELETDIEKMIAEIKSWEKDRPG